jgi:hypothetical protein
MDIRTTAAVALCALGVVGGLTAPTALADSSDPAPATPTEVPHLSSPQNLPPGTTDQPTDPSQSTELGYLRELWHEVQTQNVSMKDALLLLAQRPLDANPVTPPGLPPGPQPPLSASPQPPSGS